MGCPEDPYRVRREGEDAEGMECTLHIDLVTIFFGRIKILLFFFFFFRFSKKTVLLCTQKKTVLSL